MYKHYFVYKTTHKPSGFYYVGRHGANSLDDCYLGSGKKLFSMLNEHPRHEFERLILAHASSAEDVKLLERTIVNADMLADPLCLNIAKGGGGCGQLSEETRKKISSKLTGIKHTAESRLNMSQAHKGYVWSESSRQKQSASLTGRTLSEETRRKLAIASTGKTKSPDERAKISAATRAGMAKR